MKSVIAENLVKTYDKGKVRALDGLNLDVEEGTVLSVLGPNGAGKLQLFAFLQRYYAQIQEMHRLQVLMSSITLKKFVK